MEIWRYDVKNLKFIGGEFLHFGWCDCVTIDKRRLWGWSYGMEVRFCWSIFKNNFISSSISYWGEAWKSVRLYNASYCFPVRRCCLSFFTKRVVRSFVSTNKHLILVLAEISLPNFLNNAKFWIPYSGFSKRTLRSLTSDNFSFRVFQMYEKPFIKSIASLLAPTLLPCFTSSVKVRV